MQIHAEGLLDAVSAGLVQVWILLHIQLDAWGPIHFAATNFWCKLSLYSENEQNILSALRNPLRGITHIMILQMLLLPDFDENKNHFSYLPTC